MDINALVGTLLSGDSIGNISQMTGTTQNDVKNVLSSVLPALLNGAEQQALSADTVEGFAGALADHAKVDTSDIASFLSNVDVEDGAKIVGHLLGKDQKKATKDAANRAGLNIGKTGLILAVLAPMLMSLLGQQSQQTYQQQQQQQQQQQWSQLLPQQQQQQPQSLNNAGSGFSSSLGGMFGSLLGGGNLGSLMTTLLGGGS